MKRLALPFLAVGFFIGGPLAVAEVIELEGTIKAIDAGARTVTIERKTPKGVKTLDLEVNKKAGDLSAVKVGDTISFSYDPDLEIVTTIKRNGDAVAGAKEEQWCRFRLSISDLGEAAVEILPSKSTGAGQKSERKPLGKGKWQMTHYFGSQEDLGFFDGPLGSALHATVDPKLHCVVLEPKLAEGYENPAARLMYPVRVRVPFELEIDVSTTSTNGFPFLQVAAMPIGTDMERPVFNLRTKSALRGDARFSAWSSKMPMKAGAFMVEETEFRPASPWKKTFRLPVPHAKSEDAYTLQIGSSGQLGDRTLVRRVAVQGVLVPLVGMGIDRNGDTVFVKAVQPNSVAANAGVQAGDAIVTIAGVEPESAVDAVQELAKTHFGDECILVVKRGTEEKTVTLKPELKESGRRAD